MRLTAQLVERALSDEDPWRIGNQVLYDLCRRYPRHTVDSEIVAKIWLIGRAYSASIERGRGKAADSDLSNDRFYTEAVPKALRTSRLDEKLGALAKAERDQGVQRGSGAGCSHSPGPLVPRPDEQEQTVARVEVPPFPSTGSFLHL